MRLDAQEKMFNLINQWKASGLPIKEFCVQHQLANATFHYWLKKYRNNQSPETPAFIPVRVKDAMPGPWFAEVSFPDGKRITFHQIIDASYLKSLLS